MPLQLKLAIKAIILLSILFAAESCRKNRISCEPTGSFSFFGESKSYHHGTLRFNGDSLYMGLQTAVNSSGSIDFSFSFHDIPKLLGVKIPLYDFKTNYQRKPVVTSCTIVVLDQIVLWYEPCLSAADSNENWIIIDRQAKDFRQIEGRYHLKMYKSSDGGFAILAEWTPDTMYVANGTFSFF
jgi:hypothetical protein